MPELKRHAPDKKSPGMEYESGPQMRYQFYFEAHDPNLPAGGLIEHMRDADIVALEQVGWSKDDQKFLDKIASGALTVDEIKASGGKMTPRWESLLRAIGELKKPCFYIDIPKGPFHISLESRRRERDVLVKKEVETFLFKGDFEESLAIEKEMRKHFFDTIKIRENEIVKKFPHRVSDALKKHAELLKKSDITVLTSAGADHTPIYHALRPSIDARMSSDGVFKTHSDEIMQRMSLRMEVSDELYARSLFESVIGKVNQAQPFPFDASLSIEDRRLLFRFIASHFSYDDVRALAPRMVSDSDKPFLSVVADELKKKGFIFPSSPDEMKALLKRLHILALKPIRNEV